MNDYSCLDLNLIKEEIKDFASIIEAQSFILAEEVDFNPLVIKNKNKEVAQALKLLKNDFNVHYSGIRNVNDLFINANKGICLTGLELKDLLIFHHASLRIKKQFDKLDNDNCLRDYSDCINVDESIFNNVEDCVDSTGLVKDDASPKLKEINHSIEKLSKDLYNKAQQFINKYSNDLQELNIFTRDNRLTFLVKNSSKNKFKGYQYGNSASGLASYVEPGIFIDDNNELLNLQASKKDEEMRILRQLSYLVGTLKDNYLRNFECLVSLNVIFAKANYGLKHLGINPEFVQGQYFSFEDLCHPLLNPLTAVSNSYRLFSPYLGIVISGSNTGGKTVSLKAIGLSIIMSYLGIPIIASKAKVPFYKNIYVDIDDNQSIIDSLSTFSAHISNINHILQVANQHSLILIDELISGTDPKQAQAISLAILDKIKEIKASFIITTHFDDIKNYAYKDEQILLSAVGFNMDDLKPTYKYLENSIGSSNAIEIASRYFSDQEIIEKAKSYLKKNQDDVDILLEKLQNQLSINEKEKKKILTLENKLGQEKNEYKNKIKEFEKEKEELKKEYENKLSSYLEEIKQKAQEKIEAISNSKDQHIIKEIEQLDHRVAQEEEIINFKVGDNVRIKDNEQIGTILNIENNKVSVNVRGLTIKANLQDLTLMPKTKNTKKYVEKKRYNSVSKELNVVGQRVEDGLVLVEEYLDKANAANMSSVKIIHGIGTGALRTAIRNRLKKLSYVSKFYDGDFYDGGSAVTMVEFKK